VTRFLYLVRHGEADPHDGPLSRAGEQQARLTGQRLTGVPFSSITHGPLPRAAQTAGLIAASLPGVPVSACDLAGDYLPFVLDPDGLPPSFASFLAGFPAAERARGPELAAGALARCRIWPQFFDQEAPGPALPAPGSALGGPPGASAPSQRSGSPIKTGSPAHRPRQHALLFLLA